MSREIKFRAWDKRHNAFARFFSMTQHADGSFGIDEIHGKNWNNYTECDENVELMQFTGLKDKNGKGIYEGDILKIFGSVATDDPAYGFYEPTSIVSFKDGYFGWGKEHNGTYSFDPFSNEEIEVIGNIYENPELIKP